MQLHIKLHIKKVIYVISWPSFHYKNQSNTYEKEVIRGINSKKTSKEKEEGGGRRGERRKGKRGRWKKNLHLLHLLGVARPLFPPLLHESK
jgi:hypothetical protein